MSDLSELEIHRDDYTCDELSVLSERDGKPVFLCASDPIADIDMLIPVGFLCDFLNSLGVAVVPGDFAKEMKPATAIGTIGNSTPVKVTIKAQR